MLITLIIALAIIGITYRKRAIKLKDSKKPFYVKYRQLLLMAAIVVIPIVVLNIVRPRVWLSDPTEILEDALENESDHKIFKAYKHNLYYFPDSIPLYLEYVEKYVAHYSYYPQHLQEHIYSDDDYYQSLCLAYVDALSPGFSLSDSTKSYNTHGTPLVLNDTKRFHNYIKAAHFVGRGDFESAEQHLLKEIKLNPNYDDPYWQLYSMYSQSNSPKTAPFITSSENAKHLPTGMLQTEYFKLGEYGLYLKQIYTSRFSDVSILALIAGLMISIVWLYFLREMDLFNKERWIDIIAVFIGGALFTHLCLFIYSYAHLNLGLHINGEGWNDFFYCSGVIGFSEELVKMIPWVIFVLVSKRANEPYDYILYASAAALGFAFAENLMYLESSQSIVTRAIMSTIAHMFFASIVAYAVILAKYKYKKPLAKIMIIVVGFITACLAHGFYDFWLISPGFSDFSIITTIFFLLSLHVWLFMINNATNHSQFFTGKTVKLDRMVDFLNISFIGLIMLQFIFLSYEYGAYSANSNLAFSSWFPVVFLLYIAFVLNGFRPVRGVWTTYSFPFMPLVSNFFTLSRSKSSTSNESHVGLKLRLYAPKNNRYVGQVLPISGVCQREIEVNGKGGWYVFKLNKGIGIGNYRQTEVIIKPKSDEGSLTDDKVEIYLMLIPLEYLTIDSDIAVNDLRFTGRVYSRVYN